MRFLKLLCKRTVIQLRSKHAVNHFSSSASQSVPSRASKAGTSKYCIDLVRCEGEEKVRTPHPLSSLLPSQEA